DLAQHQTRATPAVRVAARRRRHQPLMTASGRRRATFRDNPAPSHVSTTRVTSLYAYGASSASRPGCVALTSTPAPSRSERTWCPPIRFFAWVRLIARPAPWHVDQNALSRPAALPTSTCEFVPIEPGTITG